ncbi:hypothetical protein Pmar_PMAR018490 [Perkinsus marinus ATCC 50983]|uniref:Uncharacterized protein n=1 Tax=Perkinsus marinus (strain ATCC 50983 / TXsc) TaxID=423536 RepID=C5KZZ0_PERM5|nr:hypothetical protein Pmar_PMAR018490 [Perkinsus marinus ATCC 50983]EER09848.1 hypothetical protein Pmar_PMAR018490 [Perkinsus marinus ATCC 50983]|eukprot:XP_002778053.1 hypothetical protein Pmar_PMAR018490 [Perkinsus marinus ATCC 50983]
MSISALPLCDAGRVLRQPTAFLSLYEFIGLMVEAYDKIFRQSYISLIGQIMYITMCIGCAEEQMGEAKRYKEANGNLLRKLEETPSLI